MASNQQQTLLNAQHAIMVRHILKILQQILQDFQSASDQFRTLCIKKGLHF